LNKNERQASRQICGIFVCCSYSFGFGNSSLHCPRH
jgi:hypothetical protein